MIDHILYAAEEIGYGIGYDFDGILEGLEGLGGILQFPELVMVLLRSGLSETRIQKIVGLNAIRVMKGPEDIVAQE